MWFYLFCRNYENLEKNKQIYLKIWKTHIKQKEIEMENKLSPTQAQQKPTFSLSIHGLLLRHIMCRVWHYVSSFISRAWWSLFPLGSLSSLLSLLLFLRSWPNLLPFSSFFSLVWSSFLSPPSRNRPCASHVIIRAQSPLLLHPSLSSTQNKIKLHLPPPDYFIFSMPNLPSYLISLSLSHLIHFHHYFVTLTRDSLIMKLHQLTFLSISLANIFTCSC